MRTYELKKLSGLPLYESLYRAIREDIRLGRLSPGEKLPSKRALASNLEIGKTTVEAAYAQLLEEGYITSRERQGFFVENVPRQVLPERPVPPPVLPSLPKPALADLTGNGTGQFPFSVWARLQREVVLDYGKDLLLPMDSRGAPALRSAIAGCLSDFRGMQVDPENILVGAGTDFLYNLLMQLLGKDRVYGVEDPGYEKIRKIYAAGGVSCRPIPMDPMGILPESIGDATVLHISPSHHFPTGIVTPVSRRRALLEWARQANGWIIEDDYDTEFRFRGRPIPPMQTMDPERVIYLNTFSKTLSPSIRISYMVLPPALMERFRRELGFYGCTVASFEQYTLARFLSRGYFEKHINRMRKFYKNRRNILVSALESCAFADKLSIWEQDAGLHFLLKVDTTLSDRELTQSLAAAGIRVRALSEYYHEATQDRHCLVVNYAGLREEALEQALAGMERIM